ncbi:MULTISPECIES: hypothetical protein [Pseudomonas]|uniref:Uncharacterized protein n=2 Tax=Pseudomonas TaxID=286 RepID=A0A9E6TGE8_9PSED|nr:MULTISPECIES: hypothetical protein [Pseudomonas]MBC3272541.1 hypothetical protein [Pseudomonas sp. SWRI81]MBC3777965.1 hypothetical protein [Pseudomonas sp. SWRI99]QXI17017.1 hypothetical protein HU739_024475 [Pseudomonas hamedanensis]VEF12842.1 Uncharacterised protein [Pseudomonas fluorescens]
MKESTHLLRQINPSFIQDGKITSQAFSPTPKDDKKLSCYDGDQIDPPNAHDHFVQSLGLRSVGVVAVTVAECGALELPAFPDPEPFKEHAIIDFDGNEKNDIKRKSKILRTIAEERDWLYKP